MLKNKLVNLSAVAALVLMTGTANAAITELAVNGGFETGDFTGWTQFPSGGTTQSITTINPASGLYAGNLNIPAGAGAVNNVIKQANLGAGQLVAGQTVTVSFDVRGTLLDGGVLFAENFSELDGGGVSFNDLIAIHPLVNGNSDIWTTIMYNTVLGPDVSGGFTLQLAAVCGASNTCLTDVFIDNISITADLPPVPVPAAVWLFGSALGMLGWLKRRAA